MTYFGPIKIYFMLKFNYSPGKLTDTSAKTEQCWRRVFEEMNWHPRSEILSSVMLNITPSRRSVVSFWMLCWPRPFERNENVPFLGCVCISRSIDSFETDSVHVAGSEYFVKPTCHLFGMLWCHKNKWCKYWAPGWRTVPPLIILQH